LTTPFDVYNPVYGQALPLSDATPPDDTRNTLTQTGLYGQDQIKFNDRISWTVGGRYDTTRSNTIDIASGEDGPQRDHAFTWRTGVVYLAGNGWAPYVGYAESFLPVVGQDFAGNAFKPETGEQVELGIRFQPSNKDLSFLASVYDLRRQNVLTADTAHFNESVQRGEVRSRGLELEAKASLTRTVDLVASYAYNDLKVTRSNDIDLGKTPSTSPKNIASVWTSWQVPAVSSLKLSAGVRYIGGTFGDEVEGIKVPSYTLVDAAIEFDLARVLQTTGEWKLALNVSNLTDKTYVATCGYYAEGCKYGYRRNGALTLTHRW
jgi:iron complex outermembrane receptor protein